MPKLRFPGFEGEWTKKRLSEVATGFDYGMNVAAIKFDGTNQYIRITDIDDESRCCNQSNPVSPAGILDEKYVVGVNDILFARTGAVRLLDNQYAILFIRGERAVIDKKYDLMKHKHIRQTEDGGAESYIRPVKFLDREPKYDFSAEDLRREYLLEEIEILEQEELC